MITVGTEVFVATGPVDMRWGIESLFGREFVVET